MSKHTSLSLLWRSASSSGATKVERTLGDDLLAYGTVAPQDLSAGSFRSESRRTRFTSATPGLAGVMSAQAIGARAGASRATGLSFTARFGLNANPGSSRAFVGLSEATAPILGATGASNPAAAVNTIGVGFDDANGMASGNWYLISVDGAGNAWTMDLGANAARNATDTFLLKIITLPGGTGALVVVHNLETASLVMAEVVEGRVPAAAAFLRVHAQAARYGAGGTSAALELLSLDHESGFDGTFDVRELGATGDGATDDQPAFQAAMWAANRFVNSGGTAAGGARVFVPPGVYVMHRELHIVCSDGVDCVHVT